MISDDAWTFFWSKLSQTPDSLVKKRREFGQVKPYSEFGSRARGEISCYCHCVLLPAQPFCRRRCLEETESDYVTFSNFNVNLVDRKMTPLCGNEQEVMTGSTIVVSDGNFFRVSFKSNDRHDAIGFSAYYEFRQSEGKTKHVQGDPKS